MPNGCSANQVRDLIHYADLSLSYFDLLLRNSWYRLTGSSPVFGKYKEKFKPNLVRGCKIARRTDEGKTVNPWDSLGRVKT